MKWHYVYYSYEEWKRGYIGKRTCNRPPEEDVKYLGSYHDTTFKPTQKIILLVCSSKEECAKAEILLQEFFQVDKNPHFANRSRVTSTRFTRVDYASGEDHCMFGRKHTDEAREKIKEARSQQVFPENYGETLSRAQKIRRDKEKESGGVSQETREKLSRSLKGKSSGRPGERSKEENERISEKLKKYHLENRVKCTVTGFESSPQGLTIYQKARGIDKSNRVRVKLEQIHQNND